MINKIITLLILVFSMNSTSFGQDYDALYYEDISNWCPKFVELNYQHFNLKEIESGVGLAINLHDQYLADSIVKYISQNKIELKALSLVGYSESNGGVDIDFSSASFKNLEYLHVSAHINNSEAFQKNILKMRHLRVLTWLDLVNLDFAKNIHKLKNLEFLSFGTDTICPNIAKLKKLKELYVGGRNLRHLPPALPPNIWILSIDGTKISNIDNLLDLAPKLKVLHMNDTKVYNLSDNFDLNALRHIEASECTISPELLSRLKQAKISVSIRKCHRGPKDPEALRLGKRQ